MKIIFKSESFFQEENYNMDKRITELLNQIGGSLDSPYYAKKVLAECGREILQIVSDLEKENKNLKKNSQANN